MGRGGGITWSMSFVNFDSFDLTSVLFSWIVNVVILYACTRVCPYLEIVMFFTRSTYQWFSHRPILPIVCDEGGLCTSACRLFIQNDVHSWLHLVMVMQTNRKYANDITSGMDVHVFESVCFIINFMLHLGCSVYSIYYTNIVIETLTVYTLIINSPFCACLNNVYWFN